MSAINLGDEVKHIHTGFKGIVTSRSTYLSGCDRLTIQPKMIKEGELKDALAFDEPEIELIKKKKVKKNNKKIGGFKPEVKHYLK